MHGRDNFRVGINFQALVWKPLWTITFDGIYPQLTHFLLSESDLHTKIALSFAQNQESYRKDFERGFVI
eukprot:CCRYP_004366-RA/>CCRYP_004366-RA protein AED:0.39 eAED:0.65 QI:0/0/0/1/0/0/3/0/68